MTKYSYLLTAWLLVLLHAIPSQAQYLAAVPDGIIRNGEYGNNDNVFTTDSGKNGGNPGKWYMTWDATNLYIAKTGGDVSDQDIIYLDTNAAVPVTGGDNSTGALLGVTDYGVRPTLPFRADTRIFFGKYYENNRDYVEIRRHDGNGSWGSAITAGTTLRATGTTREISISWASITGNRSGIPASFNWLGYAITTAYGSANSRFDQAPANEAALGTTGNTLAAADDIPSPPMPFYNTVRTAKTTISDPITTKPFNLKSYTFLEKANNSSFGSTDVWDFTMNSPGLQITRGALSDWNIAGSLVVSNGTVAFGDNRDVETYGSTTVGNLRLLGSGKVDMGFSPNPLYVITDVYITGGDAQLKLSNSANGDLSIGHDFRVDAGAATPAVAPFLPNNRSVAFVNAGIAHSILTTPRGYVLAFDYLSLNSPSGTLALGSDIQVNKLLSFNGGNLQTSLSNKVVLYTNNTTNVSAMLGGERVASHIIGNVQSTQVVNPANSSRTFGNIGLSLTAKDRTSRLGQTTVVRTTGTPLYGAGASTSIERYYYLTYTNPTPTFNYTLQVAYRFDELAGVPDSKLVLFKSAAASGPFTALTGRTANATTHSFTLDLAQDQLTSGMFLTASNGDAPLPVTLVSFTAAPTPQGAALLRWLTATEVNNKGFAIERQFDSNDTWKEVGYVAATLTPNGKAYEFTDKSLASAPASAQAYYRLRQEDLDGKVSYSPVAVITRKATELSTELVLSPVPADEPSLSVAFAEAGQAGQEVAILNTQGQRVLHLTTQANAEGTLSLPVANLAAGVYIVRIQTPGQAVRHARFVKL